MRADHGGKPVDAFDLEAKESGYDRFRRFAGDDVKTCKIWLTEDADLRVVIWLSDSSGGVLFQFASDHLISDFHATKSLKDLCEAYSSSRKSLWSLLGKLGLDPWARVARDYQSPMSLEQVASLHGLKPATLSKGLKERGIPIRSGRIPVQLNPRDVEHALRGAPSVNELRRRLGCAWSTAKELKIEAQIAQGRLPEY
ncbi:hypothetical protein [Roseobacter cerasinus]|uniref:hypothetical protein n=1 Tax=Roseobacter cerasinus TaxID=2602289 RepID=UPI00135CE2D1|nr:hypothetical protein [Roseobacter cerasinus]